jgi:hypothetical protein
VDVDRIVRKAPLELAGRVFNTNLIILKVQGLDVLLGLSWMKMHKAVLDKGRFSTFMQSLTSRRPYITWLS